MNITKADYERLKAISRLLPTGETFEALPPNERDAIVAFDSVLVRLERKRRADNAKAREYIAERRKVSQSYARPKEAKPYKNPYFDMWGVTFYLQPNHHRNEYEAKYTLLQMYDGEPVVYRGTFETKKEAIAWVTENRYIFY